MARQSLQSTPTARLSALAAVLAIVGWVERSEPHREKPSSSGGARCARPTLRWCFRTFCSSLPVLAALAIVVPAPESLWAAEGKLALTVVDEKTGKPVACRMHLLGPNKRPRKVEGAPFWTDHFVFPGQITLKLPVGRYTFEIERGLEYLNRVGEFQIEHFADDSKQIELRRFVNLADEGWWSGDLFVRRPAREIEQLMAADDLHVVQAVTWFGDKSDWKSGNLPKSPLAHFDTSRWYYLLAGGYARAGTEILCFNLRSPDLWPPGDPEYPSLAQKLIRQREGLGKAGIGSEQVDQEASEPGAGEATVSVEPWYDVASPAGWDLPLLVALGQVDSIEVAHSRLCRQRVVDDESGRPRDKKYYPGPLGYARWGQDVYFRLLDCGLRIPPTAGSGSGAAPNPAGYNRVYVHLDGPFDYRQWWQNLRAGQVFVTNGPLMRVKVEGQLPGYVFHPDGNKPLELEIGLTLSTTDPISYLDIIQDGKVHDSIRFEEYAKTGRLPKVKFDRSGWFLLRAVNDVSDTYRFAITGAYHVEFGSQRRVSKKAAEFFLDWVYERARQIRIDDPKQRREVLKYHRRARDFWRDLTAKANAE